MAEPAEENLEKTETAGHLTLMLFAHLKRMLELGRLRLRELTGAQDEFLLAATAQNLRKLEKLVPIRQLEIRRDPSRRLGAVATRRIYCALLPDLFNRLVQNARCPA